MQFDALLVLSFGGPDGPDDVIPFLENVVRGRRVPPARLDEVKAHYMHFGGRSPINEQNRRLLAALRTEFDRHGRSLPLYWGNRNWMPYLVDTVATMRDDGVQRAAVLVTSAFSSYSSCRQYIEDLERAAAAVGPAAPEMQKLRPFFDHPGFVTPLADGLARARRETGTAAPILMSAHSIPEMMARTSDYERQVRETARRVASLADVPDGTWQVVYQSRSGPAGQPWLGPDILAAIDSLPAGTDAVIVAPIGFVSDHMEVAWDLDTEARAHAEGRGVRLVRSATPGSDPRFGAMVRDLLEEAEAAGTGDGYRSVHGHCGPGCCPEPHLRPE